MRSIAISITVVVATLTACEVALSGPQEMAASQGIGNLFQGSSASRLRKREAELKAVMEIRSEQEAAWLEYVLARRQYAKTVNYHQRQELKDFAAGNTRFETTLATRDAESSVLASKSILKTKFDELYAILDEVQKARADKALTPSECGR